MNIIHYLKSAALSAPDYPALRIKQQDRTYGELYQRALRFTMQLRQEGLQKYDVVAAVSDDQVALVEALYGTVAAGGIFSILSPHWNATYIASALSSLHPTVILADEQHYEDTLLALQTTDVEAQLRLLEEDTTKATEISAQSLSDHLPEQLLPDEPALIVHTTGTAGRPKPVLHSHRSLLCAAFQELSGFGLTLSSFVTTGGLYLSSAINYLMDSLVSRGTHVIEGQNDLDLYLYTIQHTTPAAARLSLHMVDAPFKRYDLSSVRLWMHGGYFLKEEQTRHFYEQLGPKIVSNYGTTEVMGIASSPLTARLSSADSFSLVGKPIPGVLVRLVETQHAHNVNRMAGRIAVLSPSKALGYYANTALSAHHLATDWYDTGDIGFFDEHGYLHLLGRQNRDAFDDEVWLPQVESFINAHQVVKDSLVVPRNEALTAFVELQESATLTSTELLSFLKPYLTDVQLPKEIVFCTQFPRDERGKIRLDLLHKEEKIHV